MYGPMKQPETIPHENDIMFTMIEIFMVAKTYESITKSIQSERVSSIWRDALKFFFTTGTRSTETADAEVRTTDARVDIDAERRRSSTIAKITVVMTFASPSAVSSTFGMIASKFIPPFGRVGALF